MAELFAVPVAQRLPINESTPIPLPFYPENHYACLAQEGNMEALCRAWYPVCGKQVSSRTETNIAFGTCAPALSVLLPMQSAAMAAIVAALREGLALEDLKGMVEAAAAALEAAAEPGSGQPSAARRGFKAASGAQYPASLLLEPAQEVC
jgi:hypothetical protein